MSRLPDATIAHLRRVADWPELPGDRYEVLEPIGQGGMGTVYRARDRVLDREVALKVLRPEVAGPEWTNRLEREARVLARLEHPGVVPVHDVGTLADGRIYYLMKLIRGQRLDQFAQSVTRSELLRAFLRISEAVGFAHAHGVVHRDLKPSNIMVGAFGEVMVLDWGIARVAGAVEVPDVGLGPARPGDGQDTAPGTVLGTPGFMAPEQATGAVHLVDERTDVFALGAILRSVVTAGAEGNPIPRPLIAIWERAMAAHPAARYPTAGDVSAEITRFLDGLPVQSYREPALERLTRLYTKYQTAILLVMAYLTMRLLFLVLRGL
jgi:eukaryotic-like serine/threonine-protein kinase